MSALTAERLRELLHYDPETGVFSRRVARGIEPVGAVAGGRNAVGYWTIGIDYRRYLAHRLAWLYMHGAWPSDQVDHIDGDRSNNVFANLRAANNSQNVCNSGPRKDNASGVRGVYWDSGCKRWRAEIKADKKKTYLGAFRTKEEAAAARKSAEIELHGEFRRAG